MPIFPSLSPNSIDTLTPAKKKKYTHEFDAGGRQTIITQRRASDVRLKFTYDLVDALVTQTILDFYNLVDDIDGQAFLLPASVFKMPPAIVSSLLGVNVYATNWVFASEIQIEPVIAKDSGEDANICSRFKFSFEIKSVIS